MNWKTLRAKHPDVWDEMYNDTINDLLQCMPGADIEEYKKGNKKSRIERIAHNAAFNCCFIIHNL